MKIENHTITIIAEFKPIVQSELLISKLSYYISSLVKDTDIILTDLQSVPTGYRIMYTIKYSTNFFKHRNYTKKLSRLLDWFGDKSDSDCLSRYHYNYV